MCELVWIGKRAKEAQKEIEFYGAEEKKRGLQCVADELEKCAEEILVANEKDLIFAKEKKMSEPLLDRLRLTKERITAMAEGLRQIAEVPDIIGETLEMKKLPSGLMVGKRRVPLGVVGIIYEARPNVTVDSFGLCFKTGNVAVLKGGSDARQSNQAIAAVIRRALRRACMQEDALLFIEDTSHDTARKLMRMNQYLDVLIPRGGAGLIASVVENSTVPVIETGTGNCHIYVDEYADIEMAVNIIENAKTQRMGVCNACESLVIHEKIEKEALPAIVKRLRDKQIEIRGDETARKVCAEIIPATDDDWGKEYLDAIISVKTVSSIKEAIAHINQYNTGHSESIITKDYANALLFQERIDAAAVYVNASTRFTDGYEFGFGAEIGISTQKLHVRGPMVMEALTSTKYIIFGNGQTR